jgi:tRNA(Ile)-lysidine synthase
VTFDSATLASRFTDLEVLTGQPARYVVAFSGGLDSTVLTHCIASLVQQRGDASVLAVHVDHGLHSDSPKWSQQCAAFAAAHGIEFRSLRVSIPTSTGKGLEAAARDARYAALTAELEPGDWLLSAHHREDQAETLMLNLIRGSGPDGVAGIGEARRLGEGWLVRPMLDVDRSAIEEYARREALDWVEDPSNTDRRFDRNFLRHEVMPQFKKRWPNIAARLQRSAAHAGEASVMLAELARIDLDALGGEGSRLPIDGLSALPQPRQRNLIRYSLRELGLAIPSSRQLEQVVSEVIPARIDAEPVVRWAGASVRRYRNALYLLPENLSVAIEASSVIDGELSLGEGLGTLLLVENADIGVSQTLVDAGLAVKSRVGGEEFRPQGQTHTRKLKKLLQEEGVVPWMRDRLPLVYAGARLVAVGDLWLADDAVTKPGVALRWVDRPALH